MPDADFSRDIGLPRRERIGVKRHKEREPELPRQPSQPVATAATHSENRLTKSVPCLARGYDELSDPAYLLKLTANQERIAV